MQTVSCISLGNCNKEYPRNESNAGVDDSTTMFAHVFLSHSNSTLRLVLSLVLNRKCEWKRKKLSIDCHKVMQPNEQQRKPF